MPLRNIPEGWISDDYQMGEPPKLFCDSLVMEKSEYDNLTPDQIMAIKQKRYEDWLLVLWELEHNIQPYPPVPPLPENNE